MEATKPYKFIGFGAVDATKCLSIYQVWAVDATNTFKFIWFGAMDSTKPVIYKVWGRGCHQHL